MVISTMGVPEQCQHTLLLDRPRHRQVLDKPHIQLMSNPKDRHYFINDGCHLFGY